MIPYNCEHVPTTATGRRPRIKMTPQYLTIHSTANTATAQQERNNIARNNPDLQVSFHVVVDEKQAIECIPFNEVAWHAGDGRGKGNMTSIGLEICEGGDREKTLRNAIEVTAFILKQFGWGVDRLKQHYDWSGKNCPRILRDTGRWDWFVNEVKKELGDVKIDTKNDNIKLALEFLNKNGYISDVSYWYNNYNKLDYLYNLIIKFAEAIGYNQNTTPTTQIQKTSNYYIKDGMHFVEIPIDKFKIMYWDKPKKTSEIKNYMNLGYFASYNEGGTSFTLPVANLCADIDVNSVNKNALKYLYEWGKIENGKVYVDCRKNSSTQFLFKSPHTLVIFNDNKADILPLNTLPNNVKYAVSGAPVIINGKDASWTKEVLPQGWDNSIARATWHGFLTIKDDKIIYIGIETKTAQCFTSSEVYNKLKNYGFKDVIKCDAGGSYVLDNNGKNVAVTNENRRINSIGLY